MGALRVFATARTWTMLLYTLLCLPGIALTAVMLGLLTASGGLSVTLIGLPLLSVLLALVRPLGRAHRALLRRLVGEDIAAPRRLRRGGGPLRWMRARLCDPVAWRGVLYLVLEVPTALFALAVTVGVGTFGGMLLSCPIWWRWSYTDIGGHDRRGFYVGDFWIDTWPRTLLVAGAGLLVVGVWPWLMRGALWPERLLARGLLGPVRLRERMADLEATRAQAIDAAAAMLRRIERDLHDGAQARLVSQAMSLTLVQDLLRHDPVDLARVRELVDAAHHGAKDAIAELRDLVRGIHPPVLDQGLEPALRTLAARSAAPVTVECSLPRRPSPAIETIGYFCVAELLTNVARHSGARHAWLTASLHGSRLLLRVRDDGVGGADPQGGTGLAGLAERLRTVDGALRVDSPAGGPTVISAELPAYTSGS